MKRIKAAPIVVIIILPVFLLLASYKTVLGFTNLTPAQENVLDFAEGKSKLQTGFTEPEISHLQDVKEVMHYVDYIFYVLLLLISGIVTYYKKDKEFLFKLCDFGGKTTTAAIIILGVLSYFFFDLFFVLFHNIFFPQGNWIFAPDSLLIQTFPLEFFLTFSRNIFAVALFLGIIFILSEHFYRYVRGNWN